MKPVEALEAPSASASTPELFAHEWDGEAGAVKVCKNPERFAVDGMPAGTVCVVLLGYSPLYEQWMTTVTTDPKAVDELQLRSAGSFSYATREEALLGALDFAMRDLLKNKKAIKHLRDFRARVEKGEKGSPANNAPPEDATIPPPEPAEIKCEAIEFNPHNPRTEFPQDYIDELASSMAREGLLQRIGVRLMPAAPAEGELAGVPPAPRYRLLYGECRLRAARSLKWERIRAEVYPETLSERSERRITHVENLKRRNLNPIEEANGYAELVRDWNMTQEDVAKEVGKSRPVIANALRLLELPESVQEALADGRLTAAHGVALLRFKPDKKVAAQFPNWQLVVAAIATVAIRRRASAGDLEKGVPFIENDGEPGLIDELGEENCVECSWQACGYKYPKEVESHPAYFETGSGYITFQPEHWRGLVKAHKDAERERKQKERAKEESKAQRSKSAKTIEELPAGSFFKITHTVNAELLEEALPEETIEEVKQRYMSDKVTICTRPEFAKKVSDELIALIDEDRKAKLTPILEKTAKKIAAIKKVGPREMALLWVAQGMQGWDRPNPLDADAAKRLGEKIPKVTDGKNLRFALVAKADQVALFRIWLESWIGGMTPSELLASNNVNEAAALRYFLEIESFGLLEETDKGRETLCQTVRDRDWYRKELVQIDLAAAKAKKGGGK